MEDYLDHDFRTSPSEDRYKSPQRRAATVQQQAEAPRVAPRRSNHFNDAPPPAPSRINDHKRRSTAYAYEDCGDDYCPPPNFVGGRQETSSAADDDGRLPPATPSGREYKRRSAAYAYEDQHLQNHQHHHHQQDLGGGYNRREMMAEDGGALVSPVSPRYRHSYAEAYHRHHHQQQQQHRQHSPSPQDHPVYRHNGSLQPSGRIGIAAIHPY